MITIYQIRLSNTDVNDVNTLGWTAVPKAKSKALMMLGAEKWNPEFAQYYTTSYEVATDDLDEAFDLTNLWNDETEEKVNIVNGPSSSSSVGDIFVVERGQCFIVDSFGFKQIPNPFVEV